MKNLITFLFLLAGGYSFGQTNDIVVFSENGDNFTLFVNSIKQNEEPRANVKAKDLKGENFVLRIEFENKSIPAITKKLWTESKGMELATVIIRNRKGKHVVRYMGETPKNPDTDQYAEVEYDDYENVEVSTYANGNEESETSLGLTVNETEMNVTSSVGGESVNINLNIDATGGGTRIQTSENVTTTTTSTTITSSSNFATNNVVIVDDAEGDYSLVNTRCAYPMSPTEFEEALNSVKSKSFSDSKLATAKQICRANCMTAEQVRDMNKVFDFENTKLDFAKFAYEFVYDPSKYYKVNDSFEFEMTIEELNEYLEDM